MQTSRLDRCLALLLFLLALLLRAYRLAANPLWLDEIGGLQLARQGVTAILNNSRYDPHPPLYYLWLWLTTGGGAWASEWALRWTSVLFGALAVPLLYRLARRYAGPIPAAAASLLVLASPVHLYFSQEARSPALLFLLASLTTWLLDAPHEKLRARWAAWAALSLLGAYSGYSFLMVVAVQGLWVLGSARRSSAARVALVAVVLGLLPLAFVAAGTLASIAAEGAGLALELNDVWGALLAGDPARYGLYWGHAWLPIMLGLLAALGAWRLARHPSRWSNYYLLQVALPVAGYFLVLKPILAIEMPLYQSRQFIPLLPAGYVLVAAGFDALCAPLANRRGEAFAAGARSQTQSVGRMLRPAWFPAGAAAVLFIIALLASGVGVGRYWAAIKSPEGDLARYLQAQGASGETIVSLHYSLDAALSAYAPLGPIYTKPLGPSPATLFSTSLSIVRADWLTVTRNHSLAEVQQSTQRWLMWLEDDHEDVVADLSAGCSVTDEVTFGPFKARHLSDCAQPMLHRYTHHSRMGTAEVCYDPRSGGENQRDPYSPYRHPADCTGANRLQFGCAIADCGH